MTKEEKKNIIEEVIRTGNISVVAKKYSISKSTLYRWISIQKERKENKNHFISIRLSDEEMKKLNAVLEQTGYQNNRTTFIKNRIFDKKMVLLNPKKLLDELFYLRSGLNKVGTNVNQIANYYNFLGNNKMIDETKSKEFFNEADKVMDLQIELKSILEIIFKKEF